MAVNKVEYAGNTLIDLTNDTVSPETLLAGVTAHDASGELITGTAVLDRPGVNLLHNAEWQYGLVNQRRHSGPVSNNKYCIDRWFGSGNVTPFEREFITLGSGTYITQRMEIPADILANNTMTFSVVVNGIIRNFQFIFPSVGNVFVDDASIDGLDIEVGYTKVNNTLFCGIEFTTDSTKAQNPNTVVSSVYIPYIKLTATADVNIRRVFLEFGRISRIADTPVRDYAKSLLECQRYCVVLGYYGSISYPCVAVAQGIVTDGEFVGCMKGTMIVNLPCTMRTVGLTTVINGTPTVRMGIQDYGTIVTFENARNPSANVFYGVFYTTPIVSGNTEYKMDMGITYVVRMAAGNNILVSADM